MLAVLEREEKEQARKKKRQEAIRKKKEEEEARKLKEEEEKIRELAEATKEHEVELKASQAGTELPMKFNSPFDYSGSLLDTEDVKLDTPRDNTEFDPATTDPKFIDMDTTKKMTEECIKVGSITVYQEYFATVFRAQLPRIEPWLRTLSSFNAAGELTSSKAAFSSLYDKSRPPSGPLLALVVGLPVPVDEAFECVIESFRAEPQCKWIPDTAVTIKTGDTKQRAMYRISSANGKRKFNRVAVACLGVLDAPDASEESESTPILRVSFFNEVLTANREIAIRYVPILNSADLDFMNLVMYVVSSAHASKLRELKKEMEKFHISLGASGKEMELIELNLG